MCSYFRPLVASADFHSETGVSDADLVGFMFFSIAVTYVAVHFVSRFVA